MIKEIVQELRKEGIEVNIRVYGTLLHGPLLLIDVHNPDKNKVIFVCGHLYTSDNIYIYHNEKNGKTYRWCKKCRAQRSKKSYHRKNPQSFYVDKIKEVSVVSDFD